MPDAFDQELIDRGLIERAHASSPFALAFEVNLAHVPKKPAPGLMRRTPVFRFEHSHQERDYPSRVSATTLPNRTLQPARVFGGFGAAVNRTADFAEAFTAARSAGKPAIIPLTTTR